MDKAQKELIKKYYHARKLTVENPYHIEGVEDFYQEYEDYEINRFALENDLINSERITIDQIKDVVKEIPQILKYISPEKIKEFDDDALFAVIVDNEPENVMGYINKYADKSLIDDFTVTNAIEKNPKYLDYFKDRLKNVEHGLGILLINRPDLFEKLKPYLHKVNPTEIPLILSVHPQLIDKFDWGLENLDKTALNDPDDDHNLGLDGFTALLQRQPQLADKYDWDLTGINYFRRLDIANDVPELKHRLFPGLKPENE
jgi:hypothetical protein